MTINLVKAEKDQLFMSTIRYGMKFFYPRSKKISKQIESKSLFGKPKITDIIDFEYESHEEVWNRINEFIITNKATPIQFNYDGWNHRIYYTFEVDNSVHSVMQDFDRLVH